MKGSFKRIFIQPFEISVALLLFISGVTETFDLGQQDPTMSVLPSWEKYIVSSLGIFSGVFVIVGVIYAIRRIELSGMLFLIALFAVRLLLYARYLGMHEDFVIAGVFYASVIWAAVTRVIFLVRGNSIVWVKGHDDFLV